MEEETEWIIYNMRIPEYIMQVSMEQTSDGLSAKLLLDRHTSPPKLPTIVLVNSKSGGQRGRQFLSPCRVLLTPAQVVDLNEVEPETLLQRVLGGLQRLCIEGDYIAAAVKENLRIIVAGGDGTVGWVLGIIAKLNLSHPPPIAPIPFGTGNNLHYSFGWGRKNVGTDLNSVRSLLIDVAKARVLPIDSWLAIMKVPVSTVDTLEHFTVPQPMHALDLPSSSNDKESTRIFGGRFWNYFSLGMDAQVAFSFHQRRRTHPKNFKSQLKNQARLMFHCSSCPLSQIVWDIEEWYWPSEQRLGESVSFFEYTARIGRDIMRRYHPVPHFPRRLQHRLSQGLSHTFMSHFWTCIWTLPSSRRISFFMWMLAHGGLPVGTWSACMGHDSVCERCILQHEESLRHCFWICPESHFVWRAVCCLLIKVGVQQGFVTWGQSHGYSSYQCPESHFVWRAVCCLLIKVGVQQGFVTWGQSHGYSSYQGRICFMRVSHDTHFLLTALGHRRGTLDMIPPSVHEVDSYSRDIRFVIICSITLWMIWKSAYGMIGCVQGWYCVRCFHPASRNINHLGKIMYAKHDEDWQELALSPSIRSIIFLNLPSFSGGFDPWGHPNPGTAMKRSLTEPRVDDGILEIVGFRDGWHGLSLLFPGGHGTRLAQAHKIRLEISSVNHTYMRMDGEPWLQPLPEKDSLTIIEISHGGRSLVLATERSIIKT
ncbi:hypothetical protein L7F22_012392 [Adiantum nelumboides]|nr:hypothetical protein [Adiantum nelumboides]